jgi:predicted permease
MRGIPSDARFALRVLARQPGYAVIAILVLALGIGATAAVFSFVNVLLLRPLPSVRDAGRVVGLYARDTQRADTYRGFSYPNYVDIREGAKSLEGVSAFTFSFGGVAEGGLTRRTLVMMVSANYFELLGAKPVRGRAFMPDEEWPGRPSQVAVVSHAYWQRRGADPALLGGTISITGRPFTVVGIAPPGFGGTSPVMTPEFWLPLGATRLVENDFIRDIAGGDLSSRDTHRFLLIGRLKADTSPDAANRELAGLASRLAEAYPAANRGYTILASALQRRGLAANPGDDVQLVSLSAVLLGMSAVVLLVACLNLANMLLARGAARRKEIAIRLSLGAGRIAVVRQLLVEGFLLSLAGGAVGLTLGHWAMVLLVRSIAPLLPMPLDVQMGLDWRMTAAAVGFAALATVAFALGPALKATRPAVIAELKEQAGEDRGPRAWLFGARNMLLAGQIALSLALLVAGALFVRGALKAAAATPGFSLERGLLLEIDPTLASYSLDESADAHRRALARIRELPGVEAASMASLVPFGPVSDRVRVERALDTPGDKKSVAPRRAAAEYASIGADYFRSLGLRVLRGREFTREEAEGRVPRRVAIIDEPAARRLFPSPGENPLGQLVRVGSSADGQSPETFEIVGVVPGVRPSLLDSGPRPHLYVPFSARTRAWMSYHVRLAPAALPETSIVAVRRQLAALDARLPVLSARTLESYVRGSVFLWLFRSGARVFTAFGLAALVLALVGIYGVNAYTVARRTREIGIRMALGATPGNVLRLVVRETAIVTLAGVVVGTVLAVAIGSLLGSMLYEVTAFDPIALAGAPLLLAGSALVASYVPARGATRVSVVSALRRE